MSQPLTRGLSRGLSRALSGRDSVPPVAMAAIVVSGTLTSDGTTPVVFPTLVYAGLQNGYPCYTDTGSLPPNNSRILYRFEGNWLLQNIFGGAWMSEWGNAATPDLAENWSAMTPATGIPIITAAA